jgi:4-hydroxy-tetrahydrodipicolinate synthase
MINLKGTGVAMVTPFDANGAVDYRGLKKLTRHLIDGGIEYLVVHGTTGENVTLTADEKAKTLATVVEENNGKLPVILGIGGNNTAETAKLFSNSLFEKGVNGILSVSPYYNKPTQEGIYQHFKIISEQSDLPIIMYNVPGRTSSNMLPETTLRLAELNNIVAIKEASGNMEQIMEVIANKPKDFYVISGDDPIAFPLAAAGGDGVISVIGNAFPKEFSDMFRATFKGDMEAARELHYRCLPIIPKLFQEGNPAGVKEVLRFLGVCGNNVRLPLVPVSSGLSADLKKCTDAILT